jgi:large subunit ribosomal protein L21
VTRTLTSSPQPLVPTIPRALTSLRLYPSRCHFATRSSGDEEDEDEHYEDEGSEDEWGEEEEVMAAKKPSGKTEEEKVAEAAEIGYKVVAPLGSDEKPFKPYEPVFAIVQVCSIWFSDFSLWIWSSRVGSHV